MNARLDPRIVAARTQGRALAEHGTWTGKETITPASQGCVMDPRLCMSQNNLSEIPALRANFSPPKLGGQRGTKCRARGGSSGNIVKHGFGTTPRTISTLSRSCCPPNLRVLQNPRGIGPESDEAGQQ